MERFELFSSVLFSIGPRDSTRGLDPAAWRQHARIHT